MSEGRVLEWRLEEMSTKQAARVALVWSMAALVVATVFASQHVFWGDFEDTDFAMRMHLPA